MELQQKRSTSTEKVVTQTNTHNSAAPFVATQNFLVMDYRVLLPQLPPELRDLVYTQTVTEDNQATSTGLDFTRKVYDASHTRVDITPVHCGNPALLALQQYHFLEGDEYRHFILNNAIQLRIHVLFKGHTNTFVQEHWDKKLTAHLKNLAKRYPWLRKVTDYDVRILWKPASWAPSKKKRRIGAIAKRMVEVLTQEMDKDLRMRRGVVKAGLRVADFVVCDHVLRGQTLGLGEFVWDLEEGSARKQIREVGIARDSRGVCDAVETDGYMPSKFKAVPKTTTTAKLHGWEHQEEYVRSFRRDVQWDQEEIFGAGEATEAPTQRAALAIAEEISAFGEARSRR
ncbi:uncharacterized protein N0V89_003063 [Didymosphaeria variabile]|uniref:Uncharacterized protein n=1 Tax=Didymosphaeria variabile TaxID=1932322 RepID=A0A9W9CF50_9PLEO|nr:uncharacterized protein N0V89_003063 [Didymosphaeria variabile]KAJ4358479.1 hypothetical protein N0V89_003063 [Didymosphaeria variabile]